MSFSAPRVRRSALKTEMERYVEKGIVQLFRRIRYVVDNLPELNLMSSTGKKTVLSPHMLARALAQVFPQDVFFEDGWFVRPGQRHSWLRVVRNPDIIIDPYPVAAVGGPFMVHAAYVWKAVYIPADLSGLEGEEFESHVSIVAEALERMVHQGLV